MLPVALLYVCRGGELSGSDVGCAGIRDPKAHVIIDQPAKPRTWDLLCTPTNI